MWGWILYGVVGLVVVGFVWGLLHLRHSQKVAYERITQVTLADIDRLRKECEEGFQAHFAETLSLDDYETSARILSDRLDNFETLKKAFGREDFYWYFVLPVGAYIGELLRVHAKGTWKEAEGGGLKMEILVAGETATTHPFDKVMKQVTIGEKGDLYAYFVSAIGLEAIVEKQQAITT